MSNFASSKPVILKGLRAAWLQVYKPDEENNKFKFTGLMSPDSEAASVAKAAMLEAATGLWKENATNMVRAMAANNKALRDGNDKMDDAGNVRPEYAGMYFISASAKPDRKPQIVAQKKYNGKFVNISEAGRALVDGIDVTDEIGYEVTVPYRGCYVNAKVEFVAGKSFKVKNKEGKEEIVPNQVFARILAIQFARDGEAFGAGPTSAEGFGEEEVEAAAAGGNDLF